ncbi:MAG: LytTR family DNA-binding domain-containing protein [Lachnospiraceae bacterium]|nr:LytTR family DNA-binding domain-containing protein [Robinsoniella sp.]MDY3765249.1 LytTR family DNA-binding domain-containing protein [Lachnospiraceae bacterium]
MYFKVAICDDEKAALEYISQAIETLFANLHHTVSIDCFSRSQQLLEALQSGSKYQMYFLDIEMPSLNGIELGDYINQYNRNFFYNIIYISNRLEKVFDTFRVAPLRFIRKQYFYEEIQEAVNASIEYIIQNDANTISFETEKGLLSLPAQNVLYIEANNKSQLVVTTTDTYTVLSSINKLEEDLKPKGFIRIHRCYLLNCSHIYLIQQDSILLDNRTSIPVSKKRRKEVKEAFLNFSV